MDLSQISVAARERRSWEALDLGFVLARHWYRSLALVWMIPSLVVFVIFSLIFIDDPWVGITVCWWLKPVWDRLPMYIASRALFGETVTVRQALRQLPTIAWKDWAAWLLWRRISLTRSFDMPVTVLEGLKGEARRKRMNVLHIESGRAATWLTIVCMHLELALVFGGLGLILFLIPAEFEIGLMDLFDTQAPVMDWLFNILSYVAMALVAPFYALGGFALYISRRISLEGWDIEIRFRHLADRHTSPDLPLPESLPVSQGATV